MWHMSNGEIFGGKGTPFIYYRRLDCKKQIFMIKHYTFFYEKWFIFMSNYMQRELKIGILQSAQ